MAGGRWLTAVIALSLQAGGCDSPAAACQTVPDLAPGEVFLISCPAGEGRYRIVGAGLKSAETVDLVFDSRPFHPVAVKAGAARADGDGRLRTAILAPQGATYVRLYGSLGSFAATPLVARPPAQGR